MDPFTIRATCPPSEISIPFIQGMADRMSVSFHKYGPIADAEDRVDMIASLLMRLDRYAETGNTEFLIDAANFAMIEFLVPRHPEAHFRPTDSGESPGRMTPSGNVAKVDKNKRLIRRPKV